MFTLLSHPLSVSTPAFAGGPSLSISPIKELRSGGSSNSYTLCFPNHLGTHIDAPKHCDDRGRPLSSYAAEDFVFTRPALLDLPKEESELIRPVELQPFKRRIASADLLLLRTGFQKYRHADSVKYATRNPGISPEAATYLMHSFPRLRALGLDTISASAVRHREEGRAAHRILLSGRDFFIIEDMNLMNYPKRTRRVLIVPLIVEGVDSAPCTALAET